MVKSKSTAIAAILASMVLGGCTTGRIDTTETTSISPVTADISEADLVAGKNQFRQANYGLAEKHFRKAVELRADNSPRPTTSSAVSTSPTAPTTSF